MVDLNSSERFLHRWRGRQCGLRMELRQVGQEACAVPSNDSDGAWQSGRNLPTELFRLHWDAVHSRTQLPCLLQFGFPRR